MYTSPRPKIRTNLWDELRKLQCYLSLCVMGDFNAVLSEEEKDPMGRSSRCFHDWVRDRGMINVGFIGPEIYLETWE